MGFWSSLAFWRRGASKKRGQVEEYDAATVGRRFGGWRPRSSSARDEWRRAHKTLRARSRDAGRNNPHAARALDRLAGSTIGTGLMPSPEGRSAKRNSELRQKWKRWGKPATCDRGGRLGIGGIQKLAVRSMLESGEVFVRRWLEPSQAIPLQLEVLEADMLDGTLNSSEPRIRQGIELDECDRPIAYHFHREHPGHSSYGWSRTGERVRVPAEDVIHLYRVLRPGQLRGLPVMTPVLGRLRDLGEFELADLTKARIQATVAGFVIPGDDEMGEDPLTSGEGPLGAVTTSATSEVDTDPRGNPVVDMENGALVYLDGGRDVRFVTVAPSDNSAFAKRHLEAIAVGCGMTYMLLTGDLSSANYSSMRAGLLEYRAGIEEMRAELVIPVLLDRIWQWWLEAVFLGAERFDPENGEPRMSVLDTPCSWTPPKWPPVDPSKDVKADIDALNAGLETQPSLLEQRGWDPDQWIADQVEWRQKLEAAGLSNASLSQPDPADSEPPDESGDSASAENQDDSPDD